MSFTIVCIFHITWTRQHKNVRYMEDGFRTYTRNHVNGFNDIMKAVEWAKKDCTEEALRDACEGDTTKLASWTAIYSDSPEDGAKVIHGN